MYFLTNITNIFLLEINISRMIIGIIILIFDSVWMRSAYMCPYILHSLVLNHPKNIVF